MPKITLELSDVEFKALSCVALDPNEYLQNYATVRCQKAIKDLSTKEIERRIDAGEQIPSTREEIIMSSSLIPIKDLPPDEDEYTVD